MYKSNSRRPDFTRSGLLTNSTIRCREQWQTPNKGKKNKRTTSAFSETLKDTYSDGRLTGKNWPSSWVTLKLLLTIERLESAINKLENFTVAMTQWSNFWTLIILHYYTTTVYLEILMYSVGECKFCSRIYCNSVCMVIDCT